MPLKPCGHGGCGALIKSGSRCDKHIKVQRTQQDEGRKNAHQRGYSRKWREARLGFLAHNPLCVSCLVDGVTEEATVVDHIIPHRGESALFWNRENWQALCKWHHDRKTATEDGGFTGWH